MNILDPINLIQGTLNHIVCLSYIEEQAKLRGLLCPACLENVRCTKCNCKTPQMFYAPLKTDKDGKWFEMLTQRQWESLKENIDVYYTYIKELNETTSVNRENESRATEMDNSNPQSSQLNTQ